MSNYTLPAEVREVVGKTRRKALRKQGFILANVHGRGGSESLTLRETDWRQFLREMRQGDVLEIVISGNGQERNELVRVQDVVRTPLLDGIIHMDFLRLEKGEVREHQIPLRTFGSPRGVKDGGILNIRYEQVPVRCVPSIVPKELRLDIGNLRLAESITAAQTRLPMRVELALPPDTVLVAVDRPVDEG